MSLGGLGELKKTALGEQVSLLVVRSTDIDAAGESLGAEALPMLSRLVRNLLQGLEKARKLGLPGPSSLPITDSFSARRQGREAWCPSRTESGM